MSRCAYRGKPEKDCISLCMREMVNLIFEKYET